MDAGTSPRQARAQHRHELRTLIYVTLDQANGGVVRNLTHSGLGLQAVAAVRPRQQLRVRFELRYPRLRVETRGEVVWSTFSGQCGIRFLDVSPRVARQIDEWILGHLLEGAALNTGIDAPTLELKAQQDDGLLISPAPRKVIELPARADPQEQAGIADESTPTRDSRVELDWLSQPLSSRSLAWTVNTLVVFAALLLSVLVFLSITREAPPWPYTLACAAALVVSLLYWGFFKICGGPSLGQRLARLAGSPEEYEEENEARFR
jgi:PilZ domain